MKRLFDIVVSLIGLIILSPLMLIAALLVKLTSRGPIFFQQERVGKDFQVFSILKFRSMVTDAPKLGSELTAGRDPRITPVGHILRKTKIDELPQLLNVLKGDMSFVGPRPEVPRYVEMFRSDYGVLLSVRPGITDPASLKYRHEAELLGESADPETVYTEQILPDKIALAKDYVACRSFWFDIGVILKTVCRLAA